MACLDKLKVKNKLKKIKLVSDNGCPICDEESQIVDHLFFSCKYHKEYLILLIVTRCVHSGHMVDFGLGVLGRFEIKFCVDIVFT